MNTQEITRALRERPELAQEAQQQYHALLRRAATDAEFRQRLLSDPRGAVSEFAGHELPESFNIVFIENKADATIVLPDPMDPAAELSEAELEAVAGGGSPLIGWFFIGVGVGLAAYLAGHDSAS